MLAFGVLSWTVAAISAAVFAEDTDDAAFGTAPVSAGSADTQKVYQPRLTAPSKSNPYYYSVANVFYEYGWGMPNCTCYAWGRAYEILGHEPDLCMYSAHRWYDYNLQYGFYPCGTEPKLGAIACWKYSSGNSGHVAVVEKIADGKVTLSNSAYSGTEFYTYTAPISDPSGGRKDWIFQGYIYIGDFAAPASVTSDKPASGQSYRITSESGVNVRLGAGTGYAVIGCLLYDRVVTVTETKSAGGYTWGCTAYDGMSGWFVLNYAEPLSADPTEPPTEKPTEAPTVTPTEAPTESPTEAPEPSRGRKTGDVDGDGEVTILDATAIQRVLVKLVTPTDDMLTAGDVDSDGLFTILDANRIQCILVNRA